MLSCAGLLIAIGTSVAARGGDAEHGRYLVTIMDGGCCHTRDMFTARPNPDLFLAGSHPPGFGYFYPPNLTPDPATGLDEWSEDDIVRAIRIGERPDGRMSAPVTPYHAYAALTDADPLRSRPP
jgi:hypothetical protein